MVEIDKINQGKE